MPASLLAEPLDAAALGSWPLPLDESDDKYDRGTVLVIGGSRRTPGAVLLAGLAALRVGAGRLRLATAAEHASALALAVPEAAVDSLPTNASGAVDGTLAVEVLAAAIRTSDAVLVGPGLEDPDATEALVAGVLDHLTSDAILVVDALAIAALPRVLGRGVERARVVVSPNVGEAQTVLAPERERKDEGASPPADPVELAGRVAEQLGVVASVHGAVAAPDGRRWQAEAGGPGLGTSGSGDVLAGALVGAAARAGDAVQAACWGTFLHAQAGDDLSARVGRVGFLARELADELPRVLAATAAGASRRR